MQSISLIIVFIAIVCFSCRQGDRVKVSEVKLTTIKQEDTTPPPPPQPSLGFSVAAFLVYDDSTISEFDVLNDTTIALWNTIIGAGDAQKPSEKTKILITGKLDGLKAKIYNGKNKVVDQMLPNSSHLCQFIINNTGCNKVKIVVTKSGSIVYQNSIPFRCGE